MEDHEEHNFIKPPYQEYSPPLSGRSMVTENDCKMTVSHYIVNKSTPISNIEDNGPIVTNHIVDNRSLLNNHNVDNRPMLTHHVDINRPPPNSHLLDYRDNDYITLADFKFHDINVNRTNVESISNHQYIIPDNYPQIQKSYSLQTPSLVHSDKMTENDTVAPKVRRKSKYKIKKPPREKKIKTEKIPGKGKIVKANPCTGKRCGNDCTAKFTEEERQDLHEFYWGMTPSRQRDWLLSCIKEKSPKKMNIKKIKKLKKMKKLKKESKKSKKNKKLKKLKELNELDAIEESKAAQASEGPIELSDTKLSIVAADLKESNEVKEDVKKEKVRQRSVVYKYIVPFQGEDRQICQQFLLNTLDISQMTLRYTKKHASQFNVSKLDQRGHREPSNKTPLEARNGVINFIKSLPTVQSHSKSSRKFLPSSMRSVSHLHETFYKAECLSKVPPVTPVSLKVFRGIFNASFNIGFILPKKEKCLNCSKNEKNLGSNKCNKSRHCMQNVSPSL